MAQVQDLFDDDFERSSFASLSAEEMLLLDQAVSMAEKCGSVELSGLEDQQLLTPRHRRPSNRSDDEDSRLPSPKQEEEDGKILLRKRKRSKIDSTPSPPPHATAPLSPSQTPKRGVRGKVQDVKIEPDEDEQSSQAIAQKPVPKLFAEGRPPADVSPVVGIKRSIVLCLYAAIFGMRKLALNWRESLSVAKAIAEKVAKKREEGCSSQSCVIFGMTVPKENAHNGFDVEWYGF
ncbi:hypothetical protein HDU96_000025 [Phlyctochytrium bullatum]|nr:hypothetical protein HDU96_000025 [Phlyctochytrium bullatum]